MECPKLLLNSINLIKNGKVKRIKQNTLKEVGMYCRRRFEGDEFIYYNQSSRKIFNFIRSISSPGPFATTNIDIYKVRILSSEIVQDNLSNKFEVGSIVSKDKDSFIIKTKDCCLKINIIDSPIDLKVGMKFE